MRKPGPAGIARAARIRSQRPIAAGGGQRRQLAGQRCRPGRVGHAPDSMTGNWQSAKVLGPYGKTGRWTGQVWEGGGDDRFTVPKDFRVEMAAKNPNPNDPFSLINMCFDAKGRLFVSQGRRPDPALHAAGQGRRLRERQAVLHSGAKVARACAGSRTCCSSSATGRKAPGYTDAATPKTPTRSTRSR